MLSNKLIMRPEKMFNVLAAILDAILNDSKCLTLVKWHQSDMKSAYHKH